MGVASASLTARVAETVNFRFACAPITDFADTDGTAATYGASATVDEASGRSIAHGTAGDTQPTLPATCDGATVNTGSLTVISTTVPVHGGAAVVGLSIYADDPNCVFCGGADFNTIQIKVRL